MSIPDLEQRLTRLADQVSAPPTDATRQAVRRQAKVLHRRRRTRQAVGTGLLATLVVAGAVWLRGGGPADVETIPPAQEQDPPAGEPGELPSFTVDALGLAPVSAQEGVTDLDLDFGYSFQVFRQPDDLAGPTVLLWLSESGDPAVPAEGTAGQRAVEVNGRAGSLSTNDPTIVSLVWELDDSARAPGMMTDPYARITSWGLSDQDLLTFADGLTSRPDGNGFDAGVLPDGLREVEMDSTQIPPSAAARLLSMEAPDGTRVNLRVFEAGQRYLESHRFCTPAFVPEYLLADQSREIEEVEVLGEPAVLSEMRGTDGPGWCVTWQPTSTTVAELRITRREPDGTAPGSAGAPFVQVERAVATEVLNGLHEIDQDEWQALVEDFPPAADGAIGSDEQQAG